MFSVPAWLGFWLLVATSGACSQALNPAPGSPVAVGGFARTIVTADFNGDGFLDFATTSDDGSVWVMLGNGAGGFTPAPGNPFIVGVNPWSIAVADFNGDGKPDLAVANCGSASVSILLGSGNGGFANAPSGPVTVPHYPAWVVSGDFNGDGKQDLAVSIVSQNLILVLLGAMCCKVELQSARIGLSLYQATAARPKSRLTNATCPRMSSFANHLTCPLRIMFTVSMP